MLNKGVIQLIKIRFSQLGFFDKKIGFRIILEMVFLSLVYFLYCFYFFRGLWYLNLLIPLSTIVFTYSFIDMRIEGLENRFRRDIPKTIRKLRFYLIYSKDVLKALEKTVEKSPETTKQYIKLLKQAVENKNTKEELAYIKENTRFEWLKLLCDLVYYYKINGDREHSTALNLSRMTKIIEFVNIQQSMDNVQLLLVQKFVLILPLVGIPSVQYFYTLMLQALEQPNMYLTQTSQIMAAQILLIANIANLFINWVRKNN